MQNGKYPEIFRKYWDNFKIYFLVYYSCVACDKLDGIGCGFCLLYMQMIYVVRIKTSQLIYSHMSFC